jgi:hypothetical protein
MRNFLIAVLAIAVCVLGFMVHSLNVTVNTLKQPQKSADSTPTVPSIELQSRCAKQAEEVFKSGGWSRKSFADYISHFNVKLGRCFVEISDTTADKATASSSRSLSDAFEGKEYGSYVWVNVLSQHKKYWEVAPTECKVTMPSGEEKTCQSIEEFDTLAKAYME